MFFGVFSGFLFVSMHISRDLISLANAEFISTPLLHFKPIFDPPFEKNCKGGPNPRWRVR